VNLVEKITKKQIRTDIPEFRVGDTVKVNLKIDEKDSRGNIKTRIQVYEGLVMAIQGSGVSKTFIVRKVSGNVGTEKTLPVNSPRIDSIEVVRKGKVRRAKLNYIRNEKKAPKIKERADKKGK
jgi:large subunit ribosomal protein L19